MLFVSADVPMFPSLPYVFPPIFSTPLSRVSNMLEDGGAMTDSSAISSESVTRLVFHIAPHVAGVSVSYRAALLTMSLPAPIPPPPPPLSPMSELLGGGEMTGSSANSLDPTQRVAAAEQQILVGIGGWYHSLTRRAVLSCGPAVCCSSIHPLLLNLPSSLPPS